MHVVHVKQQSGAVKRSIHKIVQSFVAGESILDLAKRFRYPPYLLIRMIIENMTSISSGKRLTEAIKAPFDRLTDEVLLDPYKGTNLASPVCAAVDCDPMYGPRHDRQRHMVGIEYEVVLEQQLKAIGTCISFVSSRSCKLTCAVGIAFETEQDLRDLGTARTPDVLLQYPVGIEVQTAQGTSEWRTICWIDSKVSALVRVIFHWAF